LCDQWQAELGEKFHIHTAVIRTSTLARLERDLPRRDLSIYENYPLIIVSIDFVKRESRRGAFLTHCPDLVIVDEAHTAAQPGGAMSEEKRNAHQGVIQQLNRSVTRSAPELPVPQVVDKVGVPDGI
jgi:superfamily II DNA or RNA helicase